MAALDVFSSRTRDWFTSAFDGPTAAQEQAWPAIASGEHVLISAPTGSGKTLAAFLYGIDQLAADLGFADQSHLTRVVRTLTGRTPAALRSALGGR